MTPASEFYSSWAQQPDALPLLLTGGEEALKDALVQLRALFPATDVYSLVRTGKTIKIADIRAMRAQANQSAWSGNRLVIISEAETLGAAAAEALLKTLEESTRTSRFVLTTSWYRRLLPTIRSRCVRVQVGTTAPRAANTSPALPSSILARLAQFAGDTPLTPDILEHITDALERQLRQDGPTAALRTAYLRLRDYHRITAEPGSNQKVARDVLLASLPPAV